MNPNTNRGDFPANSLKIAVVCASNMNRSVEAHFLLREQGFDVRSFGTSSSCKLPGPAADKPNIYQFNNTYAQIYEDLRKKNFELYMSNGVLAMLERNMSLKQKPERWQERLENDFDIVVTFETRVFDSVIDDLDQRQFQNMNQYQNQKYIIGETMHVFNINVKDTHEDASSGAKITLELLKTVCAFGSSWESEIDRILLTFQSKTQSTILHSVYLR